MDFERRDKVRGRLELGAQEIASRQVLLQPSKNGGGRGYDAECLLQSIQFGRVPHTGGTRKEVQNWYFSLPWS
jgi:hypothetical protein